MNVVGKRGAYSGHEPTHKLSKGFANGPIDSARLSISDAFAGIDFLSVGNRYRQNKQLLRVLGEKILVGAAASEMGRQRQKGFESSCAREVSSGVQPRRVGRTLNDDASRLNRPIGGSALRIRSVAPAPLVVCGLCEGAQSLVGWRYVVWCGGREWRRRKRRGRETPEGEGRAAESTSRGCQQSSQSNSGRATAGSEVRWSLRSLPSLANSLLQAVLATTPQLESGCTGLEA
ncbi:hypothetical protein F5144DRAFT_389445 [Chaetomium tenue]|uniref:Uncharacterized protein n=1 Tax=Chaetomium tenue TaxID=1854479 RepID=A0ACB7NYM6_9PEZI|nr:hypothetical protein F5144DRAFT_389445 [Chaetomium globosum]